MAISGGVAFFSGFLSSGACFAVSWPWCGAGGVLASYSVSLGRFPGRLAALDANEENRRLLQYRTLQAIAFTNSFLTKLPGQPPPPGRCAGGASVGGLFRYLRGN
jgi:hypothetical protein